MSIAGLYSIFQEHPFISTDSRNIPPSCIFFALKGDNFDGNRYASEALSKGASYAVVDNPGVIADNRFIHVENALSALQQLALYHRRKLNIPILAITGTNGKTTTKELIAAVLKKKYRVTYTIGNLNNHIGVPLTLLQITPQTDIAVIEMGANHPHEIDFLCRIAEPDYGLVTNIGKAHLEGFGSFEKIVQTKSELYDYLREYNGKAFVNTDNDLLVRQSAGIEQLTYGTNENAQLRGKVKEGSCFLTIRALFPEGWLYLQSKLIGEYNLDNILAAARVGLYFDIEPIAIQQAIAVYEPDNNRSQLIEKDTNKIIMDAYNANPTSMAAALDNFEKMSHQHKVLILGDMLELGDYSAEEHQRITDKISNKGFEKVFLIGKQFEQTTTNAIKFSSTEFLIKQMKNQPIRNSLILIKGSHGIGLEKALEFI